MTKDTIILLKGKIDVESLIASHGNLNIYALDNNAHVTLEKNSIRHEIADESLTDEDFNAIFDKVVSLYNWHDFIPKNHEFEVDGINFLSVLDTQEMQAFLANFLYDFLIIKKIIEKELPKKIIVSHSLRKMILPLICHYNFDHEILKTETVESMAYQTIEMKLNFGKIPISFSLSRNKYLKLKRFVEIIICRIYDLWPDLDMTKNSMLFLEMNPIDYESLISEISDDKTQILFLNNRRPAIWNRKSIKILRQHGCKVIDLNNLLTTNEKKDARGIALQIRQKIRSLKNNDGVKEIFTYDGISFWDGINDELLTTFEDRIEWYVFLIKSTKKLLDTFNVKNILSQNVVGETEKAVLALNKNQIPSIMLEHAFANYTPQISRYDILSMYSLFRDRIAVWGEVQKEYLIKQHKIEENRIIVSGSPRHDAFFIKRTLPKTKERRILITPRPIIDTALHKKVESYQKYERLLVRILNYFENKDVRIIIKTHPGLDLHNSDIKKTIHKIKADIPIYQNVPIRELIETAYAHINISPEGFDLSTVVLESLIMNVPVMNIILDKTVYDFEVNKMNAIKNVFDDSTLEQHLEKLIFDEPFREAQIQKGQKFLFRYLSNMGNASKYLANELKNLQHKQR